MPIPLVDSHKFKKNDVTFQPLSLDIPGIETTYGLKLGKGGGGWSTYEYRRDIQEYENPGSALGDHSKLPHELPELTRLWKTNVIGPNFTSHQSRVWSAMIT